MKRPVLSPEYVAWKTSAGWMAKMQMVNYAQIRGRFRAEVEVPIKSRRDLDNWTKPLFDLCQFVGAVRNDRGLINYSVLPVDRNDCKISLWDMGGDEFKEQKPRVPRTVRTVGKKRPGMTWLKP